MKKPPIHALTSLRFFAALMVFFSHLSPIAKNGIVSDSSYFPEGYAGVTFFFILSGFILSYSYQDSINAGKTSWAQFMSYRVSRILPLHWLTLFFVAIFFYNQNGEYIELFTQKEFWANFFLLQAFSNDILTTKSYNSVSWSLSCEMFFYVIFPFVICLRTIPLLVILMAVVLIALAWLPVSIPFALYPLPLFTDHPKYYAYYFPLFRFSDFLLGMLLFRIWEWKPDISASTATFLQAAAMLLLLTFFMQHENANVFYRFDFYYAIPMALAVYAFSLRRGLFSYWLSGKTFVLLGELGFAFYMIHKMVITFVATIFVYSMDAWFHLGIAKHFMHNDIWHGGIIFVICLALSAVLYYLFELPAKKVFINALLFSR